jgi:hypothetical protein
MSTYFTNQHDYHFFHFANETGADLTVTDVSFPTGWGFDDNTAAQWNSGGKRVIGYNKSETYGVTTSIANNMFQVRADTAKVSYTSADGTKLIHNVPISGMRHFNHKLPNHVTILLMWGNSVPRPYKLGLRRDSINGFRYYMNASGTMGIHLQVPTSGSPKWVLVQDGVIIAEYRTFMTVNGTIDTEGAVCSFPADGSYWSSGMALNGALPNTQRTPIDRTHSSQYNGWFAKHSGLRVIYFQNKNWRRSDSITTPGVKQLKTFVYRSDRQYFTNGYGGNAKIGGVDTQRLTMIFELGITSGLTQHQVMEWEVYDSGSGQFSRFLTQLSSFTVDINRLGINPTGVMYARYRILEMGRELTAAEHSGHDNSSGAYGRTGPFTGWSPLPALSMNVTPVASSGSDGWLKCKPRVYYGEVYSDCGWDTKLTITTSGPGYSRKHPMVFPDEWVAIGINTSQGGSLQRGTFSSSSSFTHTSHTHTSNSTVVTAGSRQDPRVWIRDNNAYWGGLGMSAGTYTEGYQCCGKLTGANYTGRHHDECAPTAAITTASQDFYFGQNCAQFSKTTARGGKGDGDDVVYRNDPTPKSNRSKWQGQGYDSRISRNLSPFSSNVRSSYSEFKLTIDLPAAWVRADDTVRIEYQNTGGGWSTAIHMDGSSTYIHGYWCRWKISELPGAARNGNTWALTSANLPGRVSNENPEVGRTVNQMHTYVHRKNFNDLESFGGRVGDNIYQAYTQRVFNLKAGGHLGLGYVRKQGGDGYCSPFNPDNVLQNTTVPNYKLRIFNVDTNQHSEPFTMSMSTTNNVKELAPFCEAYDDDDKSHND